MNTYTHSVYWVRFPEHIDITCQGYVGVSYDPIGRLRDHFRVSKVKNEKNPFFGRVLAKYPEKIVLTIIFQGTKEACYLLEEDLRPDKNIGWNANKGGSAPPSRLGWVPSKSTLEKRSRSLKGVPRTDEWCKKLSQSKQGQNNPMYGKKKPCSEERRLAVIKGKNQSNFELYKTAVYLMDSGKSVSDVSKELRIGRGICYRLKDRTHGIFQIFPELVQSKTC